MQNLGLDPETVEIIEVVTDADAERLRFAGSPTIRVDGNDIVDPGGAPFSLTCRVYRLRDGRVSAVPDIADVRDALASVSADIDRRHREKGSEHDGQH